MLVPSLKVGLKVIRVFLLIRLDASPRKPVREAAHNLHFSIWVKILMVPVHSFQLVLPRNVNFNFDYFGELNI